MQFLSQLEVRSVFPPLAERCSRLAKLGARNPWLRAATRALRARRVPCVWGRALAGDGVLDRYFLKRSFLAPDTAARLASADLTPLRMFVMTSNASAADFVSPADAHSRSTKVRWAKRSRHL